MEYDVFVYFELAILFAQTLLFGAAVVFVAYWLTRTISAYLDAPYLPTERSILPAIAYALEIGPGDVVYDLGCGDGRLLFYCARRFPLAKFVGVEKNLLLIWYMRVKKFFLYAKNIEIRCENIFDSDISDATRIYAFLLRGTTARFFEGRKLGSVRVVSRAFEIPGQTSETIVRLLPQDDRYNKHVAYVYEF